MEYTDKRIYLINKHEKSFKDLKNDYLNTFVAKMINQR